jgi:hypothetical protein
MGRDFVAGTGMSKGNPQSLIPVSMSHIQLWLAETGRDGATRCPDQSGLDETSMARMLGGRDGAPRRPQIFSKWQRIVI